MNDPARTVHLWADFTCPFSYAMETVVRRLAAEYGWAVRAHPYELFPDPTPLPPPEVPAAFRPLAAEAGVTLRPPPWRPRTAKAHELALWAASLEAEAPLRRALYRAFWEEGRDLGRIDVLVELAAAVGLDPALAKVTLDLDSFATAVARSTLTAQVRGLTQIPLARFGETEDAPLLVGAHPEAVVREVFTSATDSSP